MSEPVDLTISGGDYPRPDQPSAARLVFTLGLAGMLSGLALAAVYQITKPIIDQNKKEATEGAVFTVVPGAVSMQPLVLQDGQLVPLSADADDPGPATEMIYGAYAEDGTFLGYAIPSQGAGYQDTIRLLYGYNPEARTVTGMEVLDSRETPGLGDRIYKDEVFVANFKALKVDPSIAVVKDGREADNEVDAITGATISSKAVVKIINEAHATWSPHLPEPGTEPPAPPVDESTDGEDEAPSDGAASGEGG